MRRAVALAWGGWGRVHPNPMVGAVVLREGREVASGWHQEFGGPHAERMALDQAGAAAQGSTLVVSLEPCRHQGKQPPCTDAILAAGVRRVVIGQPDPHPDAGGGAALLAARGVEVEPAAWPEAWHQNAPFFWTAAGRDRPFVAVKLATSVDGRIAQADGTSQWLSGPEARDWVQWLRAGFDALAVGGETARRDEPSLTVRGTVEPRVAPRRLVFSRSGVMPAGGSLANPAADPSVWLVRIGADAPTGGKVPPAGGHPTVTAPDLAAALRTLRTEGITTLLVEGGGRLAGALFGAGLVDRFYWVQCPLWLGDGARPAFHGIPEASLEGVRRWAVAERRTLGNDTLLVLDRESCSPA